MRNNESGMHATTTMSARRFSVWDDRGKHLAKGMIILKYETELAVFSPPWMGILVLGWT